jgi:hypothetical protein
MAAPQRFMGMDSPLAERAEKLGNSIEVAEEAEARLR